MQVVRGAIPHAYFDPSYTISTAEVAVHVLDFLYKKLDQVCLVQRGEVCCLSLILFLCFFFTSFLISSQAGVLILSGPGGRISHAAANFRWNFIALYRGFGFMVV